MEYWEKIVLLRPNGASAALSVKNSKDAATVLLNAWPERRGRCYRRAVLSCSAAIHGRVPQDLAQWAFIVAAMEAAISYEIIDPFDIEIAAVCRELLENEAFLEEVEAVPEDAGDLTRLFWWPKQQASDPSAR